MTHKVAYIWGPVSTFQGELVGQLLRKGWHVHLACKSALNLFSLSPLDLPSAAQTNLENAMGGHQGLRPFVDRLRYLDSPDLPKDTRYDAAVFSGLPPNFDEARAPRAPWAASDLEAVAGRLGDISLFVVSSLWAAVQEDGVVPEEIDPSRRRPLSHWEGTCQQYESRIMKWLPDLPGNWTLVRLPMITGSQSDGRLSSFTGLSGLFAEFDRLAQAGRPGQPLPLAYNPDSTLPFLPVDLAARLFLRLMEDEKRPQILNFASTDAVLNREWIGLAAESFAFKQVETVEQDPFVLPAILRRMLKDDILVKTRNLFEVVGRHQLPATRLDLAYFQALAARGRQGNWGRRPGKESVRQIVFSHNLADSYFRKFIPGAIEPATVQEVTRGGISVGFTIEAEEPLSFVLRDAGGKAAVDRWDPEDSSIVRPKVRFYLKPDTAMRLMLNRLTLKRALLFGSVRVEGPVFDAIRVGGALHTFFKEHPWNPALGETTVESAASGSTTTR